MAKYADILFPLKIPPLTYKVPEDAPADLKGRIVKAPLMGRSSYGVAVDIFKEADVSLKKKLREIQSIHRHCASEKDLQFLKWLSHYYIAPMGIALKSSFFEEIIKDTDGLQATGKDLKNDRSGAPALNVNVSLVCNGVKEKDYKTFLFHAHGLSDECSFLLEVVEGINSGLRGIIILVPEIGQIERIEQPLKQMFNQRVCVLHSKLGKSKRADSIRRLISGESDIVIGTRSAILAPLKEVSFIAVTGEHSPSYKAEEGLRYNARDVAVMRGFIEKRCVLLSSICPSLESVHNTNVGKYMQIGGNQKQYPAKYARPKIKVIASQPGKSHYLSLSGELLQESKKLVSKNERVLFLVNRKGYSLIRCSDCGNILKCGRCLTSLVFHKGTGMVSCRYCGHSEKIPGICADCGGARLETFGTGTERVKEEVEEILKTEALIVERRQGTPTVMPNDSDVMPFVVGTAFVTGKAKEESFGAAAFLNTDALLSQPDFRTHERLFQEVLQVSQMVKNGGRIFLQTHMAKERILRFIRDYDFGGFYKHELSQRMALDYPPFTRIVLLNIFTKKISGDFLNEVRSIIYESAETGVEALGPVEIPSYAKSYKHCVQIMIKSKDSRATHASTKKILDRLEKNKGLRINVDVDPLKI